MVIAVVGKRDATERYLKIAKLVGGVLANKGFTVLNGLAIGVDAYASEGAVEAKGKVVVVMPGGLDEVYPKSNQKPRYPRSIRERVQQKKTKTTPKQEGIQRMVDREARRAGGKGAGYDRWNGSDKLEFRKVFANTPYLPTVLHPHILGGRNDP